MLAPRAGSALSPTFPGGGEAPTAQYFGPSADLCYPGRAMAKVDRQLRVQIPSPGTDQPIWSRVGIIGVAGFVIGVAWPRLAGVAIGPSVPADLAAKIEASPSASARASAAPSAAPVASASASASAAPEAPAAASNKELVVVGPGRIVKCWDKRDKKIADCEKLLFDPVAVKRLRDLASCPSALGASGKMVMAIQVDFGKKAVVVKRVKKGSTLPSSTLTGIAQCATRAFGDAALDEVPHKRRHYNLEYTLMFYPPGKHPDGAAAPEGGEPAAGATTDEAEASGTAIVAWDTAPIRKEPKDGAVVTRIVRGTKIKILGKQGDWYKVESSSKVGWVYRGAIGL